MDADLRTEQAAWDAIADEYDEFVTPSHEPLSTEALELVGIEAGDRFLDVAAGSGALSIAAARCGATVVATDIAPGMLERLESRARTRGMDSISTQVMDGHALEFDDDAYDVSGSQFGVMLFPDLPAALDEMVRVTAPGGRVFLVVYGDPRKVEFLGFFMEAMHSVVPDFEGLPMDPPPLPFQVADPVRLRARLEAAGLTDIRIETIVEELTFTTGDHLWDWLVNSNPISGRLIAGTTEPQRAEAREALDSMLRARADDSGVATLTNPVHVGIGTV